VQAAGNLSILFDVGGIVGGAVAGALSDATGASACVSVAFVSCSVPCMWLYRTFGHVSLPWNVCLMAAAGLFVNGPYALITTAVSADLGTHACVAGLCPSHSSTFLLCFAASKHALGLPGQPLSALVAHGSSGAGPPLVLFPQERA
jgi:sugar phosphate permease